MAFLFSFLFLFFFFFLLLFLLSLSLLLSLLFNLTYTCLKLTRIKPYFFSQNKSVIKLMQVFFFLLLDLPWHSEERTSSYFTRFISSGITFVNYNACMWWSCFRSHFYSRISTTIRSHPGRPVHRSLQLAKDVFLALPVKNDAILRMATNFSKHLLSWCSIRWQIADKVCTIWVGYLQEWSSKEGKTISWGIGWLLQKLTQLAQNRNKAVAWTNSSYCFESFSPLNNVWMDPPLMQSSNVTHYPKTG